MSVCRFAAVLVLALLSTGETPIAAAEPTAAEPPAAEPPAAEPPAAGATPAEPGTICGTVRGAASKPVAPARLLALHEGRYTQLEAKPDGTFCTSTLAPGRHTLLAQEQGTGRWLGVEVQLEPSAGSHVALVFEAPPRMGEALVAFPQPAPGELDGWTARLRAMDEPAFCAAAGAGVAEAYRFLWLRTFHHPVVLDVTFFGNGRVEAVYKEFDGAGGYELGRLAVHRTIDVQKRLRKETDDRATARELLAAFREQAQKDFWTLPYRVEDGSIGLDGATWTVEGRKEGRCHVVTRWSPGLGDPLRDFAERLLWLAGIRFYYDEVY